MNKITYEDLSKLDIFEAADVVATLTDENKQSLISELETRLAGKNREFKIPENFYEKNNIEQTDKDYDAM